MWSFTIWYDYCNTIIGRHEIPDIVSIVMSGCQWFSLNKKIRKDCSRHLSELTDCINLSSNHCIQPGNMITTQDCHLPCYKDLRRQWKYTSLSCARTPRHHYLENPLVFTKTFVSKDLVSFISNDYRLTEYISSRYKVTLIIIQRRHSPGRIKCWFRDKK